MKFLCEALGFKVVFCMPEAGEFVRHARLALSGNVIMLGSVREDEVDLTTPLVAGRSTQALSAYVPNIEMHYAQAMQAGANIVTPLHDTDFGSREYHLRDPDGRFWCIGNELPENESTGETL